ncbi:MAG: hypothetical protein ACREQD_08215, partial [Candidatus Binataceae bacterium]
HFGNLRCDLRNVSSMSIFDEVRDFIRRPAPAERFEQLALRVFRYQVENVPAYRSFAVSLGVEPAAVQRIDQIPAVSTLAFKYAQMESVEALPTAEARLFLTSGTTIGVEERGRHLVLRPEIYRASALGHLRRMLFPDGRRLAMLALHPTADLLPESSLSQMISWCCEEFGTADTVCVATREAIDIASAIDFLRGCVRTGAPVCILATTAACAKLFAAIAESKLPLALPAGSRLMDTGGAKGQLAPLSGEAVIAAAARGLGLAPARVINEYGMTEMCSQLYDATPFNSDRRETAEARVKLAPPWLRPFALDPASLRPVADGAPGLLAFFDLANVGSVSMLLTEDLGVVGDGGVRILGPAATAEARGCALAIAEFAQPQA